MRKYKHALPSQIQSLFSPPTFLLLSATFSMASPICEPIPSHYALTCFLARLICALSCRRGGECSVIVCRSYQGYEWQFLKSRTCLSSFRSILVSISYLIRATSASWLIDRLPDASVSNEILARDIKDLAEIGMGGFHFVPFYLYGLSTPGAVPPVDVSVGRKPCS